MVLFSTMSSTPESDDRPDTGGNWSLIHLFGGGAAEIIMLAPYPLFD